jgi:hypothetical protein
MRENESSVINYGILKKKESFLDQLSDYWLSKRVCVE